MLVSVYCLPHSLTFSWFFTSHATLNYILDILIIMLWFSRTCVNFLENVNIFLLVWNGPELFQFMISNTPYGSYVLGVTFFVSAFAIFVEFILCAQPCWGPSGILWLSLVFKISGNSVHLGFSKEFMTTSLGHYPKSFLYVIFLLICWFNRTSLFRQQDEASFFQCCHILSASVIISWPSLQ